MVKAHNREVGNNGGIQNHGRSGIPLLEEMTIIQKSTSLGCAPRSSAMSATHHSLPQQRCVRAPVACCHYSIARSKALFGAHCANFTLSSPDNSVDRKPHSVPAWCQHGGDHNIVFDHASGEALTDRLNTRCGASSCSTCCFLEHEHEKTKVVESYCSSH